MTQISPQKVGVFCNKDGAQRFPEIYNLHAHSQHRIYCSPRAPLNQKKNQLAKIFNQDIYCVRIHGKCAAPEMTIDACFLMLQQQLGHSSSYSRTHRESVQRKCPMNACLKHGYPISLKKLELCRTHTPRALQYSVE